MKYTLSRGRNSIRLQSGYSEKHEGKKLDGKLSFHKNRQSTVDVDFLS